MAKVVMNVRNSDINNIKHNDILLYDESKKEFYKTTAESFFKEYEQKLSNLLKRYDEQFNILKNKNEKLEKDYKDFTIEIKRIIENFNTLQAREFEKFKIKLNGEIENNQKKSDEKFNNLKNDLNTFATTFVEKNRVVNEKLITMVENFIKTGGK